MVADRNDKSQAAKTNVMTNNYNHNWFETTRNRLIELNHSELISNMFQRCHKQSNMSKQHVINSHGFKCDMASDTSLTSHSSSKLVVGGGGYGKPPPPLFTPPLPPTPSVLFIQSGWLEPDDVIDPQLLLPLARRSRGGN